MDGIDEGALHRIGLAGVRTASALDLLAVGLAREATEVETVAPIARDLLVSLGRLQEVTALSAADLQRRVGFEAFESLRVQALLELGRRVGLAGRGEVASIDHAQAVFKLLEHLKFEKREHFVAVLLDAKNQIMRVAPIHVGTLTMSLVGPREVFREAVREGACSIIVAHNHPSGDPTPSPEDLEMTRKLVEVGQILDIPVVDHVIIGETYFSFHAKRLI